jgi:ketosteroid isomerase-like protein
MLANSTPAEGGLMKSASELLEAYLNNVATPKVSASQFAEDGVLELPWVKAYAKGPAEVEKLLVGMLANVPDFRFRNLTYFIQTPDKVAAEYQVEAKVLSTGKIYKQTYAGVLHAENGKIKLLREALDTVAASKAFSKD